MWEDALRVAKKASGEKAAQQVEIYTAWKTLFFFFIPLTLSLTPAFLSGRLDVGPNVSSGTRRETSDATRLLGALPAIGM